MLDLRRFCFSVPLHLQGKGLGVRSAENAKTNPFAMVAIEILREEATSRGSCPSLANAVESDNLEYADYINEPK
jgi:hypothetical protein